MKPIVERITIYPVKSLDGYSLQRAQVGKGGLLHDREYAIIDAEGQFINGKSNDRVHLLRSKFDLENGTISLREQSEPGWNDFHLQEERDRIDHYLTDFFGMKANLVQDKEGNFMDIPGIAGLTVLSTSSLEAVSSWYDHMDMEETRRRFRATIEISGVAAFWEDRLFAEQGSVVEFMIGDAAIVGISPRARCVVPTRHPETAEVTHGFPKIFAKKRMQTVPGWSMLENYGHSYYLTVNCYIPPSSSGKWIATGDEVRIIGIKDQNSFTPV